jgi:aerobic carbon-monoxide dehydrogenase large subunit
MMTTVVQEQQTQREDPLRTEDPRLLTGKARFTDDLHEPNEVYLGLVLSPLAHAKIKRIDFSKIRSSPEFIASMTGEDLVKEGVAPAKQNPWPPQKPAKRYHLAVGKVRFAGEPVAAVLVKNKASLEDLIEQVEVDYEVLPIIKTTEDAKRHDTLVYEDWKDNVSLSDKEKKGNAEKAIQSAAYVVNFREGIKRQEASPIEPHSVLVTYDKEKDLFEVCATVQSVHGLQGLLSSELKLPRKKFHVKVTDVGGGFGSKGAQSYPWPLIACLFAKKTGLPIKFTATRTEEFLEAAAGRDEYCNITLACDRDAKIIALKGDIECDIGVSGTQAHMPSLTMWSMQGPYDIPNVDLKVAAYVTNKMPIGPVRGAGAPEGCYFIERAIEVMAKKIGLDPIEFRRRNVVSPAKAQGEDYQELMDTLVKSRSYGELLHWKNDPSSGSTTTGTASSNLVRGIGLSLRGESEEDEAEAEGDWSQGADQGQEGSSWKGSESSEWNKEAGRGPDSWQPSEEGTSSGKWGSDTEEDLSFMAETARVVLNKNGDVIVYTGSSPHGQGLETAFAQLASEELGVPLDRIRVVWGDTALIPLGVGTFGSRSMATGGSAVVEASRKLKDQLVELASKNYKVDPSKLRFESGMVVSTMEGNEISLRPEQILQRSGTTELSSDSRFTLSAMSYSSGIHLCALTLDIETGMVKLLKYEVVEDCGRMINKTLVDGQIEGGVIHGVGGALLEELVYDDQRNLLTTSFLDYNIPTAMDAPPIEIIHDVTPSTVTLHGAKGVGESGTIGSYAAVLNALNDALSQLGKNEVNVAPATPDTVFYALSSIQ